jgi:hypothetical protein
MEAEVTFKIWLDVETGDDLEAAEDEESIKRYIQDSLDTSSISISNIEVKLIGLERKDSLDTIPKSAVSSQDT